ncbi:Signal transduction histidine kinase [Anaerocolumna jejuensis DSM 15929]|uniref:histidine kinase n=1 Tax=Anaerocolumna jejuensis DSM 15929 TaxID=1121322 RepID=A0A1M6NWC3_9FIRM|nr:HAMP domain-containing sensor histidine kinase [Anaerocolumna jejuensis]SHJ99931.1 Signal transduction histidine kinase [Anaerocolumna jejuensis DSM 15929]
MKILYEEPEDKRIDAKRTFIKEFTIIWAVVLFCCAGAVLLFLFQMRENTNPWIMVFVDSTYVAFVGLIVSLITRYIAFAAYTKPVMEIRKAARKVAEGDFTVRVRSQRKDGKKDEVEVLIEDFNKMVEELATTEILKGDFISNVSHEIKTPLAVIQSYAAALRREDLPQSKKQEYIDTITDASRKLSALVTNVLKLNKLEHQEIIKEETFSLDEQLRCCILALEDKFLEKDIEIDANLEEVFITTDASLLEIIWNNLLTNALKFTEPHGQIGVELRQNNKKSTVLVKDTGCGMSKEACKRSFDRFYQGDTSHSVEGNGLGLSLVKRVADMIKAEISVDSEEGRGTVFTVVLPHNKIEG